MFPQLWINEKDKEGKNFEDLVFDNIHLNINAVILKNQVFFYERMNHSFSASLAMATTFSPSSRAINLTP